MSKFSSKGIGGKLIAKTLAPGNRKCKINKIELEKDRHKEDGLFIILHLEGEKLEGFEGFFIDPKNMSLGRSEGQVGRVKSSSFSFVDTEYQGQAKKRDDHIVSFLAKIANELGVKPQLDEVTADTIEEYVEGASKVLCNGTFLNFTIGGGEYVNKNGFDSFTLFLVKATRGLSVIESTLVPEADSKLIRFDKTNPNHYRHKKKAKEISEFDGGVAEPQPIVEDDLGID